MEFKNRKQTISQIMKFYLYMLSSQRIKFDLDKEIKFKKLERKNIYLGRK